MSNELAERWLTDAAIELQDRVFKQLGETLPELRYRVGYPPGARGSRILGVYMPQATCEDGVPQIYISPAVSDPAIVLTTLTHELCHALRPGDGHGKAWKQLAKAAGLKGAAVNDCFTEATRGDVLQIAADIGEYPHGAVAVTKKQATRQRKLVCEHNCDFPPLRMSAKAFTTHGWQLRHMCDRSLSADHMSGFLLVEGGD